jgi:hypothetical protein
VCLLRTADTSHNMPATCCDADSPKGQQWPQLPTVGHTDNTRITPLWKVGNGMPGKKGHRGWVWVRQSGRQRIKRWHASYIGPDHVRHNADNTFGTKMDAEGWLAAERRAQASNDCRQQVCRDPHQQDKYRHHDSTVAGADRYSVSNSHDCRDGDDSDFRSTQGLVCLRQFLLTTSSHRIAAVADE